MADPPCQRLRAVLEDARRTGLDFAGVWPSAVTSAVALIEDPGEVADWVAVLAATRSSWEAAYAHDHAPPVELALVAIAEDPERCERIAEAGAGFCAHCGEAMGQGKRSTARYCCGRCRRDASVARLAA